MSSCFPQSFSTTEIRERLEFFQDNTASLSNGMLSRDAEPGQELGCHMAMQGWDPQPGMPSRVIGWNAGSEMRSRDVELVCQTGCCPGLGCRDAEPQSGAAAAPRSRTRPREGAGPAGLSAAGQPRHLPAPALWGLGHARDIRLPPGWRRGAAAVPGPSLPPRHHRRRLLLGGRLSGNRLT